MGSCEGFHEITCFSCAVVFQMNDANYERRLKDGRSFYCTNGHEQHFTQKESTEKKLRDRITALERGIEWRDQRIGSLRADLEYERRSRAAFQGHLHRVKRDIARA